MLKKYRPVLLLAASVAICPATASPTTDHYHSFNAAVYVRAYEVDRMKDDQWLRQSWDVVSRAVKVNKVYLETHRDKLLVDGATLEKAKAFFAARGVQTFGGITWTRNESNRFETFCYANAADRAWVKHVAEETARHFDDIILDDFFFTSCKSDEEIRARGNRTWTQYRLERMREVARDLVVGAARKINPKVRVVIKFPNWYEHFQDMGFDLDQEPYIYDGVYTGTETRDPVLSAQHLQAYNGYAIFRYFDNLRPGFNHGGWVDPPGVRSLDNYAEQLWVTLFAKAPEITLFDYRQLLGAFSPTLRGAWQGAEESSFNYDAMLRGYYQAAGPGTAAPTYAVPAGVALQHVDALIGQLGRPRGVAVYRPFGSLGEDFLPSFLGMIGIPIDLQPRFPSAAHTIVLTEDAVADPKIVDLIEAHVRTGGNVVITSGLLGKLQSRGIDRIANLYLTGPDALVKTFRSGRNTIDIGEPMLIPQVHFITNDTWELAASVAGDNGFPMLTDSPYGTGHLFVMTIPNNAADLYRLPAAILDSYRRIAGADLGVRLADGPSKVALYEYDNGTFVVESFNDAAVTVQVSVAAAVTTLRDLQSGVLSQKPPAAAAFTVRIPAHSYEAFAALADH
ncbi:MAG TPA: hypothetical protein VHW25_07470 [Steroidobacteraceae bacterium]|jgi:hypothetical protein|nr:hypothetical protein [Steroidobacteraceae bacterium]